MIDIINPSINLLINATGNENDFGIKQILYYIALKCVLKLCITNCNWLMQCNMDMTDYTSRQNWQLNENFLSKYGTHWDT
jgi:hypothetical protein